MVCQGLLAYAQGMAGLKPLISELKSLIHELGGGHGGGGHGGHGGHGHGHGFGAGGVGPWWGPAAYPCPPGSVIGPDGRCMEPVLMTTPEAED